MVHVEERQIVAINVRESHLALIGLFLHLVGSHEALWHCSHGNTEERGRGRGVGPTNGAGRPAHTHAPVVKIVS